MWIALVIRQRIPADVVSKREVERYKRDERGSPPTAVSIKAAARTPSPVVVVVHPTPVVIRRPTPWLIPNPCPTVRRTPLPISITIRDPIAVTGDRTRVRTPDPTVIARMYPIAVRVEVFGAPDVLVEV